MNEYSIVPQPLAIQYLPGFFRCSALPAIKTPEKSAFQGEIQVFTDQLKDAWSAAHNSGGNDGEIRLLKTETASAEEYYRLEILPEGITLAAGTGAGIYRGLQVLRQLFLSGYEAGSLSVPCGVIEDRPRFPWRGFMLDCSRYFYSVGFIKKLLDALSLHHVNVFHWHLSDDQGWRLPVESYPLLTEIGSKRREHRLWDEFSGGFYTKTEIKEVVSFAAARHIEVVPEIDLPGHASAILAAYPGLGCTGGPYRVEDRFGIFEDALCAGNDGIFPLAEAVFDTLAELFPSRYVHIGGDEVLFNRWAECPKCRKRLSELGLSEPAQLQGWFTARIAEMLKQRGKTAIGWDEILDSIGKFPLPKDTVVQSWRDEEGGNRAAALGHRVIMSPQNKGCYLDYKHIDQAEEPGRLRIGTVVQAYSLDPVTPTMDKTAASLVLGGQGNLWSEIIYAGRIAEYMIFPRICAIAEALWSEKNSRDPANFARRLKVHQRRLDKLDLLQYRGPLD
uniref:beta-N-acetylhexosaminidase n=1 Tax=uncultured bacterium contig00101 TaxID=1181568 RepID=A0A806KHI4_9BACT|nr:beta-hexosaminidase [uncultured bacterium contig00101]